MGELINLARNWKLEIGSLSVSTSFSLDHVDIYCCLSAWFSVVRWFVSRDAYNAFFAYSCCSFSWGGIGFEG